MTVETHKRHPPDVRRGLIIEAARECIAERGLADTSVRNIAATAGVSLGTVTYHFAGMSEILIEVIREASITFTAYVLACSSTDESALARLQHLFDASLADTPDLKTQWRLWIDYWARAARDRELTALHNERYAVWRGAVEQIIDDGMATGEFRFVNARRTAIELVGLLDGLALQLLIGDPQVTRSDVRTLIRDAIAVRLLP